MPRSAANSPSSQTRELTPAQIEDFRKRLEPEVKRRLETMIRLQEIANNADEVRERCRKFTGFLKEAWFVPEPGVSLKFNWHHGAIGEHLEAVHAGEITRLQISLPPGFMKSTTVGVLFPAWEWGPMRKPWIRYFTTSYRSDYVERDSRKHRDLVASEWFQSLWPIEFTKFASTDFENTAKGSRKAVTYNGLTSGRGNRLVLDDPISVDQAESDVERNKATRRFRETAQSRLNDPEKDAIVVVAHRVHPNDICGEIERLGLPYTKLILPMEYNRSLTVKTPWFKDPRSKEGELLHPEFMGQERVEEEKVVQGPHAWATQYQQQAQARDGSYFFSKVDILLSRPVVGVGGIIKMDEGGHPITELYPALIPKRSGAVFSVMDTATKDGKKNDGVGVGYFAFDNIPQPWGILLDWEYFQIQGNILATVLPDIIRKTEEFAKQCGARTGSQGVHIEDKDSGQVLLQDAALKRQKATPIPSEFTSWGKEGRAVGCSGYVRRGMLKVSQVAWDKTVNYKGHTKNHMVTQVTEFQVGKGTPNDEDEMFDVWCYGALLMYGAQKDHKK